MSDMLEQIRAAAEQEINVPGVTEKKSEGIHTLKLYSKGAWKLNRKGEKVDVGDGRYSTMCENAGVPEDNPELLLEVCSIILQDMKDGKLAYKEE